MFDVPVESTYVWFGLLLVGAALLGLALRVPTAPPPDATAIARTVDSVASSPHEATARQPIEAREVRLGSERVGLRNSAGAAHATFAYESIVPVTGNDLLRMVLQGRPPDDVFVDPDAFAAAVDWAETTEPEWQRASDRLLVRRITWGDVNATLVGV